MKKITLYTKPGCGYYSNAKQYLSNFEIPYVEVDISINDEAREKLISEGHKTLPIIYAGESLLVPGGYNALKSMRKEEILERLNE